MSKLTKGYVMGEATELSNLPREIRIGPAPKLGEILEATDWGRGESQKWMCIKVGKNYMESIMQKIKGKK